MIPTFVFAANDVGTAETVDLSGRVGTDGFLNRYFRGNLIGLAPLGHGKSLLRPRLRETEPWKKGRKYEGDYVTHQDTTAWGNIYSSRGYREMELRGYVRMKNPSEFRLTDAFKDALEEHVAEEFRFEYFMTWLFAFKGFPQWVDRWDLLLQHLLEDELAIFAFQEPYQSRFRVATDVPWPETRTAPYGVVQLAVELAPRLVTSMLKGRQEAASP